MKLSIKEIVMMVVVTLAFCGALCYAIAATDYTMSEEEVMHFLKEYPDSQRLRKVAESKGINVEEVLNDRD